MWPLGGADAQQACQTTGTNQTCTNAVTISGGAVGIFDTATLTLTNTASGTVTGSNEGASATTANVTNFGTIQATGPNGNGIDSGSANVINYGTIQANGAGGTGIFSGATANVTNFGTIQGTGLNGEGINAVIANVSNSGTIIGGPSGIGITATAARIANSGTITGGQFAMYFTGAGSGTTLSLLPGSRIVGNVYFGGTGNTVNFLGGNHNLTFINPAGGTTITGMTPFAVAGTQAAAIDPTPFAMEGVTLNDFTREVSAAIPQSAGPLPAGSAPLAFAAPDASARIEDAFAAIPGLAAYSGDGIAFKSPTAVYSDGTTVWARGFAGERTQQADGVLLHATNWFYGGMLGGDIRVSPDLRLGAFIGVGQTRSAIDFNYGKTDSNLGFGGVYARYDAGDTFLRAAVQGGGSHNSVVRNINNNLVAGGIETTNAAFNGWYVSPEATIGQRLALGSLAGASYTLTPSLGVRYLYGAFDGYAETGSTANLTVGSRTVSTAEERGELKLTRTVMFAATNQLSTSLYGGVLGTQRVGDTTISASLLGQAIPFATPGRGNVWGGFGGGGLEWRAGNVTMYAASEYLALSDNSAVVSGRAGLRVGF